MWLAGWIMVTACTVGLAAPLPGRVDPLLQRTVLQIEKNSGTLLGKGGLPQMLQVIASGTIDAAELEARGARVRWRRGEFAILNLPVVNLESIAATPGIEYLEAAVTAQPSTDISIPEVGGIEARSSSGLSGRDVLIGIVDSGIDWAHEDFITPGGQTRIRAILDLSLPGDYYGGTLFSEADINAALRGGGELLTRDYSGHGTHVAGIAAGDGSDGSEWGVYAGMAPEAGLVIVKASRDPYVSEFSSDDQLIAIDFIDSMATTLELPAVINLSFGTSFGGHDGSSAVERFIDSISGACRIVVAAAGNEGGKGVHASLDLAGASGEISFELPAYTTEPGSGNDHLVLDGWYQGNSQVAITLVTPRNETIGPVAYGRYLAQNTPSGQILVWNGYYDNGGEIISGPNPYNGDKEIIVEISDGAGTPPATGVWGIRLSGKSDAVDFWIASKTMSASFKNNVSSRMTLTVPATSKKVISVGAYTTRKTWRDLDGNNLTIDTKGTIKIGQIGEFSGSGPSRDGRTKPEITAPGRIIGSTLSFDAGPMSGHSVFASSDMTYPNAFVLPDGLHALSLGTSMAAPHVSGAIALLLEKAPLLTASRARQAIIYSARPVEDAEKANQWGYGKLNALGAVQIDLEALPEDPDELPPTAFRVSLPYPNPFSHSVRLDYAIPQEGKSSSALKIAVYNSLGQLVQTILQDRVYAGRGTAVWDGHNGLGRPAASGIYFIVATCGGRTFTHKVCYLAGR